MTSVRSRKHSAARYLAVLTMAGMAASGAAQAAATAESDKGTEVTVNGHKEKYKTDTSDSLKATAPLVDTPQTVTVIGDQLIREQGATTLTEALRNSPGVGTFYLGENGSTSTGDAVYMRGSDVSNSIFVDGVRDVASVSRDVFNIEQVEVLKGAAGADVGRGSATGAISLSTKRAKLAKFVAGSIGAGDGDYARATADANWRIGKDAALRLNLLAQDAGVNGRDFVKTRRTGIAGSLGLNLDQSTRYFIDLMHVDQDNIPDGGVSTIGLPGYTTPNPGSRDYLNSAARVDPRNFYGTKDDHDNITSDVATLTVEHDFSEHLRLNSITRWSQTDQEYQLGSFTASPTTLLTPSAADPSTWRITRNINNKNTTNRMWTTQTNLRAQFRTGPVEHTISTGVELIGEEQVARLYAVTGAYPTVSVYNPDRNVGGYSRALSGAYTVGKTDTAAIYINDTMKFTPQWQLSGGLRIDHYNTTYTSVATTNVATVFKASDDLVSGKLGLVYKPLSNGSVYLSYAVTQQPPGGANFTLTATNTANVNNPNVDPQTARTSEAGTKWNLLHDHLALTAAVYSTRYSDAIAQDTDGTYYRTGEKTVSGIELGAAGQITKDWGVSAGYTIMDSNVKNQAAITADGSPNLTYNPSDAASLWTTYSFGHRFTLGGGMRYNGKLKRGTDGAVGTPRFIKSYVVWDGVAKYRLTRGAELQLNAYNLFDKVYAAAINKSGYRYTPGQPRTVKLALNVHF